jgi:hypothetical protein
MFLLKATTRKVDRCERAFAYLTQKQEKQIYSRVVSIIHLCDVENNVEASLLSSDTRAPVNATRIIAGPLGTTYARTFRNDHSTGPNCRRQGYFRRRIAAAAGAECTQRRYAAS